MGDALLEHDFVACRIDFKKLNPPWAQAVFQRHPQQHGQLVKAPFRLTCGTPEAVLLASRNRFTKRLAGLTTHCLIFMTLISASRYNSRGVELHFISEAVLHIRCRDTLRGLLRQACHWAEYSCFALQDVLPREQ